MMRPSVSVPTGTMIGAFVFTTMHAAAQAVGAAERDRAHDAVAQLLLHLERQPDLVQLERVVDLGDLVARKFHVDHRADALNNRSLVHSFPCPLTAYSDLRIRFAVDIRRLPRRRRSPTIPS